MIPAATNAGDSRGAHALERRHRADRPYSNEPTLRIAPDLDGQPDAEAVHAEPAAGAAEAELQSESESESGAEVEVESGAEVQAESGAEGSSAEESEDSVPPTAPQDASPAAAEASAGEAQE